jgi:UDP-3-O-[3-hydroxymyristoyl] glucosamine N-acyltransferase
MEFTAKQISELLNGKVEGDPDVKVSKLSKIEEGTPGSISFLANPLYTQYIYSTKASVIIVKKDFSPTAPITATLVRVDSPENAFALLLEKYNQIKLNKTGISKQSFIAGSAKVGSNVYVGEFAVIGENVIIGNNVKIYPQVYVGDNSMIGDDTTLFSGVKIYSDNNIGKRCILHSGTVIGSDGFRFALQNENKKIPQIGNVILEDDVEVGGNCAIDRATLGSTILRKGVKMDNLVHIAHNVEIGSNTYIAANCVIAGSTKIGNNCMLSGQVGVVGHLTIADNTILAAQAGISKSILKKGGAYLGSPAFEITKYKKAYIHFKNLETIVERIEKLERSGNK